MVDRICFIMRERRVEILLGSNGEGGREVEKDRRGRGEGRGYVIDYI